MDDKEEFECVDNVHELQQREAMIHSISDTREAEVLESLHMLARILLSANIPEVNGAKTLNLSQTSKNIAA